MATTSRMCRNPPSVFLVMTPSSHKTIEDRDQPEHGGLREG